MRKFWLGMWRVCLALLMLGTLFNATQAGFAAEVGNFSISGRVVDREGDGLANVRIYRSGSDSVVLTNANGEFRIIGLTGNIYTLVPRLDGYTFDPPSRRVTVSTGSATGANFVGTRALAITGRITNAEGAGVANVTVRRNGTDATVTTNASGEYRLIVPGSGTYIVAPSLSGVTFEPRSRTVTVTNGNVASINFSLVRPVAVSVSGRIVNSEGQPIANVRVTRSSGDVVALTNTNGEYRFNSLTSGTYTIVPRLEGYTFDPTSRQATVGTTNVTGINFVGGRALAISGRVTNSEGNGVANVVISRSGSETTVLTNANGEYRLIAPAGTYTLTPSRNNFTFGPTSSSVTLSNANVANVNFVATAATGTLPSITGRIVNGNGVGITGVTIRRSGSNTAVLTDAQGRFVLPDVAAGTYTITPSKEGLRFEPSTRTVTVGTANATDVNFIALTAPTTSLSIVGRVTDGNDNGVAGVTIRRSGSDAVVVTDAQGRYTLSNVPSGTYTITPSKAGSVFDPTSRTVTVGTNGVADVNFIASPAPIG